MTRHRNVQARSLVPAPLPEGEGFCLPSPSGKGWCVAPDEGLPFVMTAEGQK